MKNIFIKLKNVYSTNFTGKLSCNRCCINLKWQALTLFSWDTWRQFDSLPDSCQQKSIISNLFFHFSFSLNYLSRDKLLAVAVSLHVFLLLLQDLKSDSHVFVSAGMPWVCAHCMFKRCAQEKRASFTWLAMLIHTSHFKAAQVMVPESIWTNYKHQKKNIMCISFTSSVLCSRISNKNVSCQRSGIQFLIKALTLNLWKSSVFPYMK